MTFFSVTRVRILLFMYSYARRLFAFSGNTLLLISAVH